MTHLETYLDTLKILPNEFQREFVLMGELDKKAAMVAHEIDVVQASILELASKGGDPNASGDTKKGKNAAPALQGEPTIEDRLAHLRALHQMSVDLSNEKLALAKQSRDMIVSHAARLDDDIELFKEELPPEALRPENEMGGGGGGRKMNSSAKENRGGGGSHSRKSHGRRRDSDSEGSEMEESDEDMEEEEEEYEDPRKGSSHKKNANNAGSSEDVDQTLYCICQQVSHGDMVGCDNENCPYEWFHFDCVGEFLHAAHVALPLHLELCRLACWFGVGARFHLFCLTFVCA